MAVMLEVLEWVDPTGNEMIYRLPQQGSADFKLGAQLIVRDSQLAVFFKDGHAADSFTTGRHTLSTLNIPILTRLLSSMGEIVEDLVRVSRFIKEALAMLHKGPSQSCIA